MFLLHRNVDFILKPIWANSEIQSFHQPTSQPFSYAFNAIIIAEVEVQLCELSDFVRHHFNGI